MKVHLTGTAGVAVHRALEVTELLGLFNPDPSLDGLGRSLMQP